MNRRELILGAILAPFTKLFHRLRGGYPWRFSQGFTTDSNGDAFDMPDNCDGALSGVTEQELAEHNETEQLEAYEMLMRNLDE